jgi:serine/threonine-protein kinase
VEHTLALSLDGYVTQQVTLTMRAGQVEDLNFELERLPLAPNESILRLDTVPEDARVQFDGEWYDSGSPYEFRVAAGRYRVVVAKSGWRNESERIALRGGQVTEHRIRLRPDRQTGGGGGGGGGETTEVAASGPGTLTFDARPWCNVSIDGQAVGQTPIVNRSLPSGRHRITCTNPDLGVTRNVTVDIEPGQPTRQRISLE